MSPEAEMSPGEVFTMASRNILQPVAKFLYARQSPGNRWAQIVKVTRNMRAFTQSEDIELDFIPNMEQAHVMARLRNLD